MAQKKISELTEVNTLDYVVGIKNGSTYKAVPEKPKAIYSDEEQKIGTWIDGKDLYRKTMTFDLSEITSGVKEFDISGLSGKVIMVDHTHSYLHYPADDQYTEDYEPLIIIGANQGTFANMQKNSFYLQYVDESTMAMFVGSSINQSYDEMVVTFEYTKASDYE